jgi:hypothetical protein
MLSTGSIGERLSSQEKRIAEALQLLEKKMAQTTDDKVAESRRKYNENLTKAVEQVKNDYTN